MLPAATSVTVGRVVDAAQRSLGGPSNTAPLTTALVVFALVFGLGAILGPVADVAGYRMMRQVDGAVRRRVIDASQLPPGLELAESPGFVDQCRIAGGVHGVTIGQGVMGVFAGFGRWATRLAAGAVIARYSLPMAVGLGLSCPMIRAIIARANFVSAARRIPYVMQRRRAAYLNSVASGTTTAKELRVFGLEEWAIGEAHRGNLEYLAPELGEMRWMYRRSTVAYVLRGVTALVGVVPVGLAGARGWISLGLMTATVGAVLVLVNTSNMGPFAYELEFAGHQVGALQAVEDQAMAAAARPGRRPAAASSRTLQPIRFEQVSFAYPGGERSIFDGLDLTLVPGTSTALVGANGAGKTTLVKLLAGLYAPTSGRITAGGVDIAELDPGEWRKRLAIIFQDFVQYEMSAADNIRLRDAEPVPLRRLEVAAQRAGCLDLVQRLPHGWDTVLSRRFADGAELSGGQWQRVALARALAATDDGADILILDEPTANLDVRAEAALFDRFVELTRGLTTILISHRFSTVRRADRICLIDAGSVVEDGTHDELVAARGLYAELFDLQAARFRGRRADEEGVDVGS